jgi:hypothetical protein
MLVNENLADCKIKGSCKFQSFDNIYERKNID